MLCKACGRTIANESANFCDYCGTSFRENIPIVQDNNYAGGREHQGITENSNEENEKSISFRNWIGSMLLPFIPFIGPIIYLVMMFVWAFSSDTPKSKKNWARASLIVTIVVIVLLVYLFSTAMTQMVNSGFNMDEYMNQYYNLK